mmetsp:Transcript_407/g.1204  ORF Transcript_407/g.1204 Transcript_407/m.1204 type:complete len:147 (+) Transcript_407:251-691(+)
MAFFQGPEQQQGPTQVMLRAYSTSSPVYSPPPFGQQQQLQTASSMPYQQAESSSAQAQHDCTRFCTFTHEFGNVFRCQTSGTTHICDQNCQQRVQVDAHSSVCRLSRKTFNTPLRQSSLKRPSETGDALDGVQVKQAHFDMAARCF